MADATKIRIGTDTSGRAAYLHPVAAACWQATVPLVKARLDIDLSSRIIQALGAAAASAGTHGSPPVAVDIRTRGLTGAQITALVALLRECGWAATWYRDWAGNQHIHAATDIGVWTPALYQITAVKAGFNGLADGKGTGRGGPDPHPKPSAWRTAQQGTAWARQQLQEEDMPLTDQDIVRVQQAVHNELNNNPMTKLIAERAGLAAQQTRPISRDGQEVALRQEVADSKSLLIEQAGVLAGLMQAIGQLAAAGGGALSGLDLEAVEAAARRGAQVALKDARVVVDLGGGAA